MPASIATTKRYIRSHKTISVIVLLALAGAGYWGWHTATAGTPQTQYVLGTVTRGTVVASVSASGQVSASDQIDLKPQVSGTITWIGISPGQKVVAGQALVTIDDTTAKQDLASAEATLATDELQYQKDQASAPIDYQTSLTDLQTAKDNLASAYVDAFNSISTAYLDLPKVTTGMDDILYGLELNRPGGQEWNVDILTNMFQNDDRTAILPFADTAKTDYQAAIAAYDPSLSDYQKLTRTASTTEIDAVLAENIDTETAVAQALQSQLNFLGKVTDLAQRNNMRLSSTITTLQSDATSYLATVNGDLNALLSIKKTLDTDKQAITSDQNAITLLQVGNPTGGNPISLQISAANLTKEKQDIQNMKDDLAKYTVAAPFAGTISAVDVHVGDSASGAVATIVTNDRVATLSLNEVDAAKVKLGDRATLTFDAIDGLTLTGTVAEIDPVGTVSQGVVSYDVKIQFSSQDTRVKPGMTVNAAIQTAVAENVLTVPSSAVKTTNGQSYVQVVGGTQGDAASSTGVVSGVTPASVLVTTGVSDDTTVEITSGLSEGETIVTRTTSGSSTLTTAAAATSRTSSRPGGASGGAVFRAL